MWRYIEAIKRMIAEEATEYKYQIINLKSNRLFIKKDRIIENTVFIVCLEIKMNQYEEDRTDIL